MARKIEITIQTDQILIVHGGHSGRVWCTRCNREVDMVTLEAAGVLAGADAATIQAQLRSGDWHTSPAADGTLRICLDSLVGRAAGINRNLPRLGAHTPDTDERD